MNDAAAEMLGIRYWPGYAEAFTRNQFPGAKYANGSRVVKVENPRTEDHDLHPPGAVATVLGSMGHPDVGVAYFVEFDMRPGHAVMIVEKKIGPHG